jgi:hypothetical protein
MADSGKLEKLLILAFTDSTKVETGGIKEADDSFEALINPETYTLQYKLKFSKSQGQGTSGTQLKYEYTEPEEMAFDFLFDNTGIIDGKQKSDVSGDLKKFKDILTGYKGDSHEPRHFKLLWGANSIFKGRVIELTIVHKLFKSDGTPIRAVATVKFKSSIDDMKRAAAEDEKSSDLMHTRKVMAGDSLPLLCNKIYGDSRYYFEVARYNGIDDFRNLEPGTTVYFPPLDKTS